LNPTASSALAPAAPHLTPPAMNLAAIGSPAARHERSNSLTAFRGESALAALSTASTSFPQLLTAPVWRGPQLPTGVKIQRYIGTAVAVVNGAGGKRGGVLESSVPLVGKTPDGSAAPTDLGLVDAGGLLAPASAAVALRIPRKSSGSLTFPDAGIGVSLMDAATTDVQVANDRAFFANVLTDSDLVMQAAPRGGAELSLLLRSPASPSDFTLAFSLPAGDSLEATSQLDLVPAPKGSVAIVNGGTRVGLIPAARAVDAQGTAVAVSYAISGTDQLEVHVDHAGALAYPLYVDPEVDVFPNGAGWLTWTTYQPNPNPGFSIYQGPYGGQNVTFIAAFPGSYSAFVPANIFRQASVDSFIYQAEFYNTSLTQGPYPSSYEYSGLYNANPAAPCYGYNPGSWTAYDNESPSSGGPCALHGHFASGAGFITVDCAASCTPTETDIPDNNIAVWGMTFSGSTYVAPNTTLPYVGITNGSILSSDRYRPTLASGDVTPNPNWTKAIPSTALSPTLTDRGLGLASFSITDSVGGLSGSNLSQRASCPGAQQPYGGTTAPPAPCPLSWSPATANYSTTASTPETSP